ncbi:MAG TPA: sigma 54-interacting transcriptional regulator [Thermoanaerobaculia bacterium]|nr:sigma 54-interacting transcriptional regulator [Thermoanaerobaculia bacterium]
MNMRGGTRRARPAAALSAQAFAWGHATIATLRHSTLPWTEAVPANPLSEIKNLGARDRLSIVAQFAAHQALLQFAGIADGDLALHEWSVVQKRASDVRLVRVAARAPDPTTAPPVLTLVQELAEFLGVELEVLQQSWARADAIYADAFARLSHDAAADLKWARAAACGAMLSPTVDGLLSIVNEPARYTCPDEHCLDALLRFAQLDDSFTPIVFNGTSPLERYSALGSFDASLAPNVVAERILAKTSGAPHVFLVTNEAAFDAGSREAIAILGHHGTWLLPRDGAPLPPTRWFLVAPRLHVRDAMHGPFDDFVQSSAFDAYLANGDIPSARSTLPPFAEPTRSYLAALALLGTRIPRLTARRFLEQFVFSGALEELAHEGVCSVDDDDFVFAGEAIREEASRLIPIASRPSIARVAATHSDGVHAALLWLDAGDTAKAIETLEATTFSDARSIIDALHRIPAGILTPSLASRYAHALIDCGRYRDARDIAPDDERVLARAERRMGDYATALTRLERLHEASVLRAEVLRLLDREEEAKQILDACDDSVAARYERALHGADNDLVDDAYLRARVATYRALERGDFEAARNAAEEAHREARVLTQSIDASLDRVFSAFSAGAWDDARALAVEALHEVEETQGDRAAGGILFTLAYLAADDGQWAHAAQRISRLRRFYQANDDVIRIEELQLLTAQLDFSRGRFADARRAAHAVWERPRHHEQIREAAALILDELDWLENLNTHLRSKGRSGNAELTRRHEALRNGTNARTSRIPGELAQFRAAIRTGDDATARALAAKLALHYDPAPAPAEIELRILRSASIHEFPFAAHDFDVPWCFATRNRLGQWNAHGSHRPDSYDDKGEDWIECSERERLYIQHSSRWSIDGRDAVAAIFRTRAENHRLKRILEQDEQASAQAKNAIDGIIGRSPQIRELESLVARIAKRDVPVCILGDSGTGKELVARAIHRQSSRRQKQFTAVNCAALPENLIESELFGHVRGAFTGADRDRAGLIETTDGGTLFLDEIGELPLPAQAKLLRFLQEGEFRRVGDSMNRSADVRIVSATNRRLASAVEAGQFRDDLYYRVRGVELALPPLRERGADILLLAEHFLANERDKHRGGAAAFSSDVEAIFTSYAWPGNVRELQNTIRGAHAMAGETKTIDVEHLPERLRGVVPARATAGSYQDAVMRFKRELIERSLFESRGNQNRAAAALKMSRQALAYQIRELGILVRTA